MSNVQQPSAGRIVHYVLGTGQIRPAVITQCFRLIDGGTNPGMSNLKVFLDGPNDPNIPEWQGSVLYSEVPLPGRWHWPPRV